MSWPCRALTVFCLGLLAAGPVEAAPAAAEPAPPLFHGNWCGAGDANRAAPVDAFDAACRAHDLCYERAGRDACICDRTFLRATAALVASPRLAESVRSKAATANSLFSARPCAEAQKERRRSKIR
jgi:hypothetical protein